MILPVTHFNAVENRMHDMAVRCRAAKDCGKLFVDLTATANICTAIESLAKDMAEMKKAIANG